LQLLLALGGKVKLRMLFALFLLALGGAALEVVGVGLVFPLISLVHDPSVIEDSAWLAEVHAFVGAPSARAFVIMLALGMVGVFVVKALYMALLHHIELRILADWKAEVGGRLIGSYLHAPYAEAIERNSADPIRTLGKLVPKLFDGFVRASLTLAVNTCAVAALIVVAIVVEPLVLVVAAGVLILLQGQNRLLNRRLRRLGEEHAAVLKHRQRTLQESFGGLKEAKVLGREDFFRQSFEAIDRGFVDNRRRFMFIGSLPPHLTEVMFAGGILLIVVGILAAERSAGATLANLAVLAAASFRLAPLATRMLTALNQISYGRHAAEMVVEQLERLEGCAPAASPSPGGFREVRLEAVSFRHPGVRRAALKDVDLVIPVRECLGLIGPSGAGKSTLGDILLGLLQPTEGRLLVDGEAFAGKAIRDRLAAGYVPQHVFIADATVRRNVAFALPDGQIDDQAVWTALEQAHLSAHVAALPDGLETVLGENGARISAGQRQRIGLARALYRRPGFLVLDEITSALDRTTECAVVETIAALKAETTIVVIAHRQTALAACDRILRLDEGRLRELDPSEAASVRADIDWQRRHVA